MVRRLGRFEDAVDLLLGRLVAVARQPEDAVRLAAHRTDADALRQAELVGRDARVDAVREPRVAAGDRLRDGRCVHARRRFERVAPDDGGVRWGWDRPGAL